MILKLATQHSQTNFEATSDKSCNANVNEGNHTVTKANASLT